MKFDSKLQLACVLCAPIMVGTYLIAFWAIAGFIPPTDPTDTAREVANFYDDDLTAIRLGMVISIPAAMLLLPFYTAISAQIARIEKGRFPILAVIQIVGGAILLVFFLVCSLLWLTASYRVDGDPATIRTLHDFGWIVFVMAWSEYSFQMAALGTAILIDKSKDPVWPRWFGYFCFWTALSGAGGSLAVFFKDGIFAWNGMIGFYLGITVFCIWVAFNTYFMWTGIKRQAAAEAELSDLEDRALAR